MRLPLPISSIMIETHASKPAILRLDGVRYSLPTNQFGRAALRTVCGQCSVSMAVLRLPSTITTLEKPRPGAKPCTFMDVGGPYVLQLENSRVMSTGGSNPSPSAILFMAKLRHK